MTTFKVNPLSRTSINDTIALLREYRNLLDEFLGSFMNEVGRTFDEILKTQAPASVKGMWTYKVYEDASIEGSLNNASRIVKSASCVFIFDGKVEFVEFGTGIKGENRHIGINEDWLHKLPPPYQKYNDGPMIIHHDDRQMDYWIYYDESGRHWTQGVPANPFIYRSFKELQRGLNKIGFITKESHGLGHTELFR